MKSPLAECPKCKGSGKIPIGSGLLDTLNILKAKGPKSAPDIHMILDDDFITITAINQRLEDLRKLGLVCRVRQGRAFIYSASPKHIAGQEDK